MAKRRGSGKVYEVFDYLNNTCKIMSPKRFNSTYGGFTSLVCNVAKLEVGDSYHNHRCKVTRVV